MQSRHRIVWCPNHSEVVLIYNGNVIIGHHGEPPLSNPDSTTSPTSTFGGAPLFGEVLIFVENVEIVEVVEVVEIV